MKIVFLIGISGSGKSFFTAWLKRRWPCEVISSDEERERKWGNRFDSEIKADVLDLMLTKCREAVSEGQNVILDSTYFNNSSCRKSLYDCLFGYDAEFVAVEFPVCIDECIKRDSFRCPDRKVGAAVIERQARELEIPSREECRSVKISDISGISDALCIPPAKMLEILAPAGDRERLEASIVSGCDAVYGGMTDWNARSRARNFTPSEYAAAVRYCHASGVKFYLTVNTLVRDDELDAIVALFSSGDVPLPDAFIVADVGLMSSLRKAFSSVPLHISTQGGVATPEDAMFYKKLGASRLILARELTYAEIARIHKCSGLEIEVFGFGSQCVAFSGQCLWGGLLGGCSGNRGRCLGMCRDVYESGGRVGNFLYPRDLAAFGCLGKMAESGVCSMKIEGRRRRPQEIVEVVSAFRSKGESEQVRLPAGKYEGFLAGEIPQGMFASVNPRVRSVEESRIVEKAGRLAERIDFEPDKSLCAVDSPEQLRLANGFGFREFIMPWQGEEQMERILGVIDDAKVLWKIPRVDFKHSVTDIASVLARYGQGVVIQRISQLAAFVGKVSGEIVLGMGGNVWNSRTMEIAKAHGVSSLFISPEQPIADCADKSVVMGMTPVVSYWGRIPVAVTRGCFREVGACNGACHGHTGCFRNVGKGYALDLHCDRFSNMRTLVPKRIFFSGNEVGSARKCVSFCWMDIAQTKHYLRLAAEGELEDYKNIYNNTASLQGAAG